MAEKSSYRDLSKTNWMSDSNTIERINAGSLQRIADASEKTAAGFEAVLKKLERTESDLNHFRRLWNEEVGQVASRDRTIASLKGQITKLKNKLKHEQEAKPAGGLSA